MHGTEVVCEDRKKANILNEYFSSVFTREDDSVPCLPALYPGICDPVIGLDGVVKLLRDLKPNKASGPDMIPNRVLKEAAVEIAPFLVMLFQTSLDQEILPKEWKHAYVSPIYKKGDRSVTRYLVRVHKWSGRTSYDSINGPGGPFMFVISGPLET